MAIWRCKGNRTNHNKLIFNLFYKKYFSEEVATTHLGLYIYRWLQRRGVIATQER